MPVEPSEPVVTTLVCFTYNSHARLRVQWAPGIPCALYFAGRTVFAKTRTHRAARPRRFVVKHERATLSGVIARLDRATQYSRDGCDGIEKPRRAGCPGQAGA